ncbi:hypothetical protein [Lichenibacterium ramalinae]|uniref:hypothetical protein n=1 Tax=Lichenibacterium ramalinae TaxID=2316527 RepID=UPI00100DDBEF|nr:hypothetical protein [Lichenibacterium ramalinae]
MFKESGSDRRSRFNALRMLLTCASGIFLLVSPLAATSVLGQAPPAVAESSQLPANWRDVKDGVDGYPAGPMLEIALRRTHSDKLEMFKWRSEFIAMLSAQPGPLVEREWHSIKGIPENTGAGTWTGMTWWENQQRWQDMANMLFSTPVAEKWLKTLDMTMLFVKPLDSNFDLHTLAQSGGQVLELGLVVFQTSGANAAAGSIAAAGMTYLDALNKNGAETYRFAVYPNPSGFIGPFTVAYKKNGPPDTAGEEWFVYMVTYHSKETRDKIQAIDEVHRSFAGMSESMVKGHSDIQVMTRTTSQVCIKKATNACSLDPDECHVGEMGSGDTWAASCGERPQPCMTEYNVCSQLSPRTCGAVGGRHVESCP